VDTGPGRLPEPAEIADLAQLLLERPDALPRDLTGRRVVVSAGGTREPLDPVRFLGNRSSGRQGFALARVAAQRGAEVALVTAHAAEDLVPPASVRMVSVGTAEQLREAMLAEAQAADAIVMAAAVADFRPDKHADYKIKKSDSGPPTVTLATNPDILVELVGARRRGQVVVGFAAETGDVAGDALHHGREKLRRKGCDLLVVNAVGEGRTFEQPDNAGWLLAADGGETELERGSKALLASRVWDAIARLLP
jgi:phosphopantothenoylcysteine decarboxylase / phosphopantothenate---cysteine ligase